MEDQVEVLEPVMTNGINVTQYDQVVEAVREDPSLAGFQFRATNVWHMGGLNRTTISTFFGAGEEQGADERVFVVDADEPPVLLGDDTAPNPVEYVLHALTACLTSAIVYKAAARGVKIESIESSLEGDMDARSFLELSDEERRGYREIRADFRVESDASTEDILELAKFSPVFDIVSNPTPISIRIEKI